MSFQPNVRRFHMLLARKRQYIKLRGRVWQPKFQTGLNAHHANAKFQNIIDNPNYDFAELKEIFGIDILNQYADRLSKHPLITMADVLAHPQINWNFRRLSRSMSILAEDIIQNPKQPWNSDVLVYNPNILPEHLPLLSIPPEQYEHNPNVRNPMENLRSAEVFFPDLEERIEKIPADVQLYYGDEGESWSKVCASEIFYINFKFVLLTPVRDWDKNILAKNPAIKEKHLTTPYFRGCDRHIARNPGISAEFIQKYTATSSLTTSSIKRTNAIDFAESADKDIPPRLPVPCLAENVFLWHDYVYQRAIKRDIKRRRTDFGQMRVLPMPIEIVVIRYLDGF